MRWRSGRGIIAAACLVMLGGCEASTELGGILHPAGADPAAADDPAPSALLDQASASDPATTGSIGSDSPPPAAAAPGSDPKDDLNLGKKQYQAGNFSRAERYFHRAAELHPGDAEAWVGLAAADDRLRRFDQADRAYREATAILGPTAEILNNQGYSYLLRGDYAHARETLLAAAAKDPKNPYVKNNLELLDKSIRGGQGSGIRHQGSGQQ
jgi:tetratricopeptide (TPR) repeat protein